MATSGEAEAVLAQVAQQPDRGLFAHQPEGGRGSRLSIRAMSSAVSAVPARWSGICSPGDRPGDLGYPRPGDHVQKLTSIKCSRVGRVRLGHH